MICGTMKTIYKFCAWKKERLRSLTRSHPKLPLNEIPIVAPLLCIPEWRHKNLLLRPSKTVELQDGDFLHITHIVHDSTLGDVTLRGQRLQRGRSMNGLLEKKLNESCFFHEVDLDDPRPPLQQVLSRCLWTRFWAFAVCGRQIKSSHLVEISTLRVSALSLMLRWRELTARWKYTCTYATAADRWHNNPKERTLEFLQEDESTGGFGVSDKAKRLNGLEKHPWRLLSTWAGR